MLLLYLILNTLLFSMQDDLLFDILKSKLNKFPIRMTGILKALNH